MIIFLDISNITSNFCKVMLIHVTRRVNIFVKTKNVPRVLELPLRAGMAVLDQLFEKSISHMSILARLQFFVGNIV